MTDFFNDMFLLIVLTLAGVIAGMVFCFTGHAATGILVANVTSWVIWPLALIGIVFFPGPTRRICSSDWLVDWIVRRKMR